MKEFIYAIIAISIWGSFTALTKISLRSFDSQQFQLIIFAVASLSNLSILILSGKYVQLKRLTNKQYLMLVGTATLAYAFYVLYFYALTLIDATQASSIFYTWVLILAVLETIMFRQRVMRNLGIFLVGFVGVIMITNPSNTNFDNPIKYLPILIATISWAFFNYLSKRSGINTIVANQVYFLTMLLLSIVNTFIYSSFDFTLTESIITPICVGMFNLALSYLCWIEALKLDKRNIIPLFAYFLPFINLIYLKIFLGSSPAKLSFLGLIVVTLAIIFKYFMDRKYKNEQSIR